MSGSIKHPYKYCGICTQRLKGYKSKLNDHWELNHADQWPPEWLKLSVTVEDSVYSNFDEHCESPDTVTLKWKPELKKVTWNRHRAHKLKIQKSEIQEDKFILDDLFAESAPIGKSSPAIFN